jgi:exoribonuclease R
MDYLNLWESFTTRIATLYLPDKKRSMLPHSLSQLCSLNEGQQRICLVMDYNLDTQKSTFCVCGVKVKKNYIYTDEIVDKDYTELVTRLSVKKPNDLVSKLMILFNTQTAQLMKQYKNGIYKNVTHDYDFMKNQASGYELYSDENNYMHITSPIRRLIDILNMTQLTINLGLFSLTNAEVFHKKWIQQLDYMNLCFKNIKKVQNQCNLLSIFESQKHKVFKGYVYDKIVRSDNKFKYQVHIYDININYDLTILDDLDSRDYMFKLYVFHDEAKLKKKVKLQLID